MKKVLLTACLVLALTIPANAQLMSYTGMLTTANGGVIATGNWADPQGFKISWVVDEQAGGAWRYAYQLTDEAGNAFNSSAVSHFIVDISDNATAEDFYNFDSSPWEINSWDTDSLFSSNTLKLDYGGDGVLEWSFFSTKAPTWGDFYAKDGRDPASQEFNTAWNAGYNIADPLAVAPTNGSYLNKILRPDTFDTPIPEPGTLSLLGLGLLGIANRARRRRKQ